MWPQEVGHYVLVSSVRGQMEVLDSLQWHFRERDDRNEDYNTDGQGLWVAGDGENVRSDFVADVVAKHEPTNDRH
jgi:hypothetical protein